jgi:hypothetical protein
MNIGISHRWLLVIILLGFTALLSFFVWHGNKTPKGLPLSVLFIGNSYTSANSLPDVFAEVAASAGYARPTIKSYTPGGQTFQGQLTDINVKTLITNGPANDQHWDIVVLQEQSEVPAAAQTNFAVNKSFLDGAKGLYQLIKDTNPKARVILYETWARYSDAYKLKQTDPTRDGYNSADMAQKLKAGYEEAARTMVGLGESSVTIARVGELWEINYNSSSPIRLHGSDNSHPNFAGTYVAALDIFSTIYDISPQNVTYYGTLPKTQVETLRNLVSRNFPDIKK